MKKIFLRINWKHVILDFSEAWIFTLLLLNSLLVGYSPNFEENSDTYWTVFKMLFVVVLVLVFVFRCVICIQNEEKPYIKSFSPVTYMYSFGNNSKWEDKLMRNAITQGDKVKVVLVDGFEHIGTVLNIVLGVYYSTSASMFLSDGEDGQICIHCDDIEFIEKYI